MRYAGEHRYATNQKVVTNLLGNTKKAYVAAGTNFPDALAGSILAGKHGVPVILTDADKLPAGTADILSGYNDFTVLGSSRVVNDFVVNELEEIANK
ncbi:cell wall-binding repeat-containing protein [Priestia flexa]|nr:cell wall-binding repeat-containing protein [Priestia flexa]